jgi:hypothetical protein
MSGLVPTGTAQKAFNFGYSRGWLSRLAKTGKVTPAKITPTGHYLWDLDDLARQFEASSRAALLRMQAQNRRPSGQFRPATDVPAQPKDTGRAEAASPPIGVLHLRNRTHNSLRRHGIHTMGQLLQQSDQDLLGIRNFGAGCLRDLHAALDAWHE